MYVAEVAVRLLTLERITEEGAVRYSGSFREEQSVEESPKCESWKGEKEEETRARRKREEERPWLLVLLGARRKMPGGTK